MLRQRLTEYGAMLNGRMRWQLTGKLPGVSPFTIVITIELDGTISSAEVTQSTGSKEVDQAALQRVLALSPLPPPPFRLEGLRLQGRAFPQK
jgi:TonB family protein